MVLQSVKLNLLPVLRELLRSRSVSITARTLGRSPPAVSESLAQLRRAFGDPLLVRVGRQMELTPRATALVGEVEAICGRAESLFETSGFDPARDSRLIVIAAHDFHVFALGPDLVCQFREVSPGFTLRFVDLGPDIAARFAAREVDFAIMPDFHLGDLAGARLFHRPLVADRTVVMMRGGHELAQRDRVDRAALTAYEHIAFHPNWEPVDYRKPAGALRRHLPIRTRIAQITMVPFFLIDSDYIALAPEALAQRIGPPLGLVYRHLERSEPAISSVLAWSPVQDSDAAHRWFREEILRFITGMLPRNEPD